MHVAVDGGATNLRMALVDGGEIVRRVEVQGFQWTAGGDPVEQQAERVVAAWQELGRPEPLDTVALGLAGVSDSETRGRLAPLLVERLHARKVALTGDDVTNHLGVLGGEPGVVVAAGTGVACLAVTADGTLLNIDGLGYLFGDLGGAFSIGQAGLRAALAAVEGRGPATALVERAIEVAGSAEPLPRAMRRWYKSPTLIADVAAFATQVSAAAETDAVARRLCEDAGRDLADSVRAAARGAFGDLGDRAAVPVSWSGSVFGSPAIRRAFVARLEGASPSLDLREPRGDSMAGAVRLAVGEQIPHLAGVVVAERS
ncbi:MAG TPA: BadF/BadG/BcrA/BcrD ATPase family protein [Actinopolymorphaceae bacterium]